VVTVSYTDVEYVRASAEGSMKESPDLADEVWVQLKIDQAERLLIARRRSIPARVDAGTLALDNVRDAVANAVLRVARNPEGFEREQEGEYGYGQHRDVAAGKLFFTGDDYALVDPASGGFAFGSVRIGIPAHRRPPR
jgi:hypothetical protein